MLDNVLDATVWPLKEQGTESAAKRRIGLGFLGLGDALIMMGLRYDSPEGRADGLEDFGHAARCLLHRLGRAGQGSAAPSRCSTPTST